MAAPVQKRQQIVRFTWKRYLKMLGSEQRGKYRIGRAEFETVDHAIINELEGLRTRQGGIIYPHPDIRCGDFEALSAHGGCAARRSPADRRCLMSVQKRQQIFETVPVRHRVLRYMAISLQLGAQRNDARATATRERNASNSIRLR
jgi:hypothetical protein